LENILSLQMIIHVKVKPNSLEQSIEKMEENYVVRLKSTPSKLGQGKANLELIKLLKKYFGSEVKIKSGFNSRRKIVEILN
jgi:uncharacterized protein (TIGR00251 family)